MASLGTLPPEVFNLIARVLADGHCERSLAALAASCRGFYEIVMPHLYHQVVERHPALLHWAAYYGRLSTAQRLIEAGVSVDTGMLWDSSGAEPKSFWNFEAFCAYAGKTPRKVYRAIQGRLKDGNIVITTKPIPRGRPSWFPIHLAAMSGSLELVELLVKTSPATMTAACVCHKLCDCLAVHLPGSDREEMESMDIDDGLPLHVAACHGHNHVVKWLLKRGCVPAAALEFPTNIHHALFSLEGILTALHNAARLGQVDMIEFILDGGYQTDVNVLDIRQFPPIWYAYHHGHWDAVDALVARGADINDDVGFGYTPLIDACLRSMYDHAVELIDRGADVNVGFHSPPEGLRRASAIKFRGRGIRPIDICCWTSRPFGEYGLSFWPNEESQSWQPRGPPQKCDDYFAEKAKHLSLVSRLLRAGADFNQDSEIYPSPLVVAAANHLSGVVEELIKHGAAVNMADQHGVSPLAAAFVYDSTYCGYCPFHLRYDYNQFYERAPFFTAGEKRASLVLGREWPDYLDPGDGGCPELRACVEILLRNGADVNQADLKGNPPLGRLFAAPCFRSNLGDHSSDVLWITPADRSRIGSLLLQHGADPQCRIFLGSEGQTSHAQPSAAVPAREHWPCSAVEHACWDADFEACKVLLSAGMVLSHDTVLWMIRLVLEESQGHEGPGTPEAFEFFQSLPAELRDGALRDPVCIAAAIRRGWLEKAQEFLDLGPELCRFSQKTRVTKNDVPSPVAVGELVELGAFCLNEAAAWTHPHATSLVEGLLELGVRPIPPSALLHAVDKENDEMLSTFLKHGAVLHVRDRELDDDRSSEYPPSWKRMDDCVNPVKLAIHRSQISAIRVMLKQSQDPLESWFRYFYLKEAYTSFKPATLACMLEHPIMRFDETDITDEADLPLAHLVRNADRLCAEIYEKRGDRFSGKRGPWSRTENIGPWMACVAAFAHAGADPRMRDRAGRSTLEYLGEHLTYAGKDRFRRYFASELRSVGGEQRDGQLDPATCWEAIKALKVPEAEEPSVSTGPDESEEEEEFEEEE